MPPKKDKDAGISWINYIGLLILVICYAGALWNVFQIKKDELMGKKVIRLCHWQLEMGVREGIDKVAREFEKQHPETKVVQIPITERVYAQWATTQLIGRTAPDLIELGMFDVQQYLGRYFVPITDELHLPNPYNKDHPQLKNVIWKDTFIDGLQNSYIPSLLEYYGVGLSQFSVRIFYNKDAFRRVVGTEEPPASLQEFFSYCEKIDKYVAERNAKIDAYNQANPPSIWVKVVPFVRGRQKKPFMLVPVASSSYQVHIFRTRYAGILTADRCLELDMAMDGNLSYQETISQMLQGNLTLEDEKYRAGLEVVKRMTEYFTPGFMSVDRMDSGFSFVQGRACMITSGSWDAASFIKKVNDQPFGDIILEVDGKSVENVEAARTALLAVAGNDSVTLKVNREGSVRTVILKNSVGGDNLWISYGIKLENHDFEGKQVPTVVEIDSVSSADDAGMFARRRFEVGIFDFPLPTKDDPDYGKYFAGDVAEGSDTAFNFGVVKFSKNRKLAINFMQFATTPEMNQILNDEAQWIPAVKGTEPTGYLKAFKPNYKGYWGWLNFYTGARSTMVEKQAYWPYISGDYTYDEYIERLKESMPEAMAYDYLSITRSNFEGIPDKNLRRSSFLQKMVFAPNDEERAKMEVKLTAAWDTLRNFELAPAKTKAIMAPAMKDKAANEFAKKFFQQYDRIADRDDGGSN